MICTLKVLFFCQNHSQCNRTVCGGDDFYARDDCVAMGEDGEWTEVGTMMEFRTDHACWDIEGELYIKTLFVQFVWHRSLNPVWWKLSGTVHRGVQP